MARTVAARTWFLVSLMLVSLLPLSFPTASAQTTTAVSVTNAYLTTFLNTTATPIVNTTSPLLLGWTAHLVAKVDLSIAASCTFAPNDAKTQGTLFTTAGLVTNDTTSANTWGAPDGATSTTAYTSTNSQLVWTKDITLAAGTVNGAPVLPSFEFHVTPTCLGQQSPPTASSGFRSNGTFILDNSGPKATLSTTITRPGASAPVTAGRIGDTFYLNVTNITDNDTNTVTIDARGLGYPNEGADLFPLSGPSFTRSWVIQDSSASSGLTVAADGNISVHASIQDFPSSVGAATNNVDGPTIKIDSRPPTVPSDLALAPKIGGWVWASYTNVTDSPAPTLAMRFTPASNNGSVLRVAQFGPLDFLPSDATHAIVNITKYNVTPDTNYAITLIATDTNGNTNESSTVAVRTAIAGSNSITTIIPASTRGRVWPNISGQWFSPNSFTTSSLPSLALFLQNSSGAYWDGTLSAANFKAAKTVFPNLTSTLGSDAHNGSYALNANGFPNITNATQLPPGSYTIGAQFIGDDASANSITFYFDNIAPLDTGVATDNRIVAPADGTNMQGEPLTFRLDYTDADSPFPATPQANAVTFTVVTTAAGNPPFPNAVSPATVTCRSTTCSFDSSAGGSYSATGSAGNYQLHANVSLVLPSVLPFGSYGLNVSVRDAVGNPSAQKAFTGPTIVPRVNLLDQPGSPLLLPGNQIGFFVYAGYNLTDSDPAGCTTQVCPVTLVEIYGRNVTTSSATPLGTKDTPRLLPLVPTHDAPGLITFSLTPDSQPYYNYTSGTLSTGVLNPNAMLLTARAVVQNTAGVTVSSTNTTWKLVRLPSSGSAISFLKPSNDAAVFMDTASKTVAFNVTYDKSGLDAPPTLTYFVVQNGTNTHYVFNASMDSSNVASIAPSSNAGSKYYYNFSNTEPLPPGEYVLNASIVARISNQPLDPSTTTRFFAVQNDSPVITFNPNLTGIFPPPDLAGGSVGRNFDLGLDINHGFANVSLNRLNLTLRPTGTTFNMTNTSPAGFRYWFNGTVFNASNLTSTVIAHIKMPDNATEGTIWTLNVSVTTDSADFGGRSPTAGAGAWWLANGTALRTVKIDLTPPGTGLYYEREVGRSTNDSGNSTPVLNGFADDHGGSGVKTVKVRITDLNATPPLMFDINAFNGAGGFVALANATADGQWLSSANAPVNITNRTGNFAVGDVKPNATLVTWLVDGTPRHLLNATTLLDTGQTLPGIAFNRDHWYQVDIAAADNVTDFTSPITFSTWLVNFDPAPPVISASSPIAGPAKVNWHGDGQITVNARDNHCINRVTLTGKTPSGADVPRADFSPTNADNAACTSPLSNQEQTWRLNLGSFPNVTDEIGTYAYTVEVVDQAGQVTRDTTHVLSVTTLDTQPAIVKFLTLSPPVVPTGGRSILTADVFENHKLLYVNATFQRLLSGGSVDQSTTVVAPMRPLAGQVAANGSGKYEIWSDTDLHVENLTVGDYLWSVRAIDDNMAVTCPGAPPETFCPKTNIIVRVADSTTPFVQQDAPAPGVTVVGASPTFHWRVLGANITANGITLRTGPVNGTLDVASPAPTITALAPVGNVATGYDVAFTPSSLAGVSNYSVNLTASNVNGVAGYSSADFTVDALPPTVTQSVSNAVVIGGVTYATSTTRITLNATDNETRVASLTYRVNGGQPVPYAAPFAATGPDGAWQADYVATDLAGNSVNGTISLHVDATPPVIALARGGDSILLTVSDAGVGVDEGNVTVHYAYGSAPTYSIIKATKVAGNSYQAQLPGNATATGLRYFFDARDLLGNLGAKNSSANPIIIEKDQLPQNLAPKLTITAPTNGSELRDAVDLKWIAEDPEGKTVTIAIAIREPVGTGSFLVTNGDNTGSYHVDLANKPAGSYTLVVTATDGVQSAQESVTFTIPTQRPLYECLSCPASAVQLNKPISFGIGLNPLGTSVTGATYNVTRDGQVVSTGIMKQQAGAWVLSYTPTSAGKYKIFVTETDANGATQPAHEVNSFEVQGATAPTPTTGSSSFLPPSFIALIAIGVLTIALAAYGAFVRWK